VVAQYDDRTLCGVLLDQVEDRNGVGAVADEVAQKSIAVRSQRIRVRKARGDRFEVAVDVCEQGDLQAGPAFWIR
jgi:hypothetical protein